MEHERAQSEFLRGVNKRLYNNFATFIEENGRPSQFRMSTEEKIAKRGEFSRQNNDSDMLEVYLHYAKNIDFYSQPPLFIESPYIEIDEYVPNRHTRIETPYGRIPGTIVNYENDVYSVEERYFLDAFGGSSRSVYIYREREDDEKESALEAWGFTYDDAVRLDVTFPREFSFHDFTPEDYEKLGRIYYEINNGELILSTKRR